MRLLLGLHQVPHLLALLLQLLGEQFARRKQFLQIEFADRQLFAKLENRRILGIGRKQGALIVQSALALGQPLETLLELGNTRLLYFSRPAWLGTALVEALPLFLPGLHRGFRFFQLTRGFLGRRAGQLLFRFEHGQLFIERRQQGAVVAQVRFGFQPRLFGLAQIVLQLAQALLAVLNALLDACDVATDRMNRPCT
ncbi:hypothetical protein SSTU70S_02918 [Stutzerimonas stutzeri]